MFVHLSTSVHVHIKGPFLNYFDASLQKYEKWEKMKSMSSMCLVPWMRKISKGQKQFKIISLSSHFKLSDEIPDVFVCSIQYLMLEIWIHLVFKISICTELNCISLCLLLNWMLGCLWHALNILGQEEYYHI